MRYGKISEAIWSDERFQELSDRSKLLYIYLLSCQNCTCIGIFQIGYGTMEDEFYRDRNEIRDSIDEIKASGLIGYENKWMWFNKFLRWNMPLSPNHAKQCAWFVHECILKGAPVAAIWGLMGSARQILAQEKYQTKDGKKRSYWDDFKAACDVDELRDYLGGSTRMEACLEGKAYPDEKVSGALPKGSANTFKTSTGEVLPKPSEGLGDDSDPEEKDEGLNKGLASTTEALRTHTSTSTSTSKQTSNQTRPVPTRSLSGVRNYEKKITVTCKDGELHEVPLTTVLAAISKHPGIDIDSVSAHIAEATATDIIIRPDPNDAAISDFYLNAVRINAIKGGSR